jgi:hypothetical protein
MKCLRVRSDVIFKNHTRPGIDAVRPTYRRQAAAAPANGEATSGNDVRPSVFNGLGGAPHRAPEAGPRRVVRGGRFAYSRATIASFTMDEALLSRVLGEWIGSLSKGRKLEPLLCALFAFAGVGTLLLFPELGLAGCFAIAVAVFQGWRYVSFKRRWLSGCVRTFGVPKAKVVLKLAGKLNTEDNGASDLSAS